jgi:hypothetical protein
LGIENRVPARNPLFEVPQVALESLQPRRARKRWIFRSRTARTDGIDSSPG